MEARVSKLGSRMGSKLGPESLSILAAGRAGDDPTTADRARVKRALMRSIAASAALGATSAASTAGASAAAAGGAAVKATSIGLGIKLLGGAVIALAVGSGVLVHRMSAPERASMKAAPIAATEAAPAPSTPALERVAAGEPAGPLEVDPPKKEEPVGFLDKGEPRGDAPDPPALFPPVSPVGDKGEIARSRQPAPFPSSWGERAGAEGQSEEDPLAAETRRLREAHGALQSGDPKKALVLLDEPQGGQLGQERAAARVLALCQLGRGEEAEAARAAFLREHPRSPLADRVRNGCSNAPSK
jgi:hypothetical protein